MCEQTMGLEQELEAGLVWTLELDSELEETRTQKGPEPRRLDTSTGSPYTLFPDGEIHPQEELLVWADTVTSASMV